MLSLQQVLISTLVGAVLAYAVVVVFPRTAKIQITVVDTLLIALTVGVSILLWREAGNTPALNDDPIPVVSPNDVLCPIVTYVSLGLLAAFRTTVAGSEWSRLRAILTLLSLAVNVVTI
jgi:hypothetical protein